MIAILKLAIPVKQASPPTPTRPFLMQVGMPMTKEDGVFMKSMKLKAILASALLFASGSVLASSFEYTASGSTQFQARMAATQQGIQLCKSIGYSWADVEILRTWDQGGGNWFADAIATCI